MTKQPTEAIIYLAENRICKQDETFRSNQMFANKPPIHALYRLDEDTLGAGKSMETVLMADSRILILPIVGAVEFEDSLGKHTILESGESLVFDIRKGQKYSVSNPFKGDELVNFLQIAYLLDEEMEFDRYLEDRFLQTHFDMQQDKLVSITDFPNFSAHIGIFEGRKEGTFDTQNPVFVYAIQGAFEVQNRLLQPNDGLFLTNIEELEWEALSNQAILLIMEFGL